MKDSLFIIGQIVLLQVEEKLSLIEEKYFPVCSRMFMRKDIKSTTSKILYGDVQFLASTGFTVKCETTKIAGEYLLFDRLKSFLENGKLN